jgi:two-component system, NtrC family, sensor histidine kinase HydH
MKWRPAMRTNKNELFKRLVLQVTAPSMFVGICLLAVSALSLWQLDRSRGSLSRVLSQNVAGIRAATRMEDAVRRLRFANLEYLLDGKEESRAEIVKSRQDFEQWFQFATEVSQSKEEQKTLQRISNGYSQLQAEIDKFTLQYQRQFPPKSFREVVEAHPLSLVLDPCRELAQANEDYVQNLVEQEAAWSQRVHWIFLALGLFAPLIAGVVGYNVARRMGKRLLRLQIQIGDTARQLHEGVADIEVKTSASIDELDAQMQYLSRRVQDIAMELSQHQRDAMRHQQLAAVGQLAASLAHEIRNPLTAIKMLVEAGLRDSRPRPLSKESMLVVHREVKRLEQTVQELLDFARPPTLKRTLASPAKIIEQAVELVQARAKRQRVVIKIASNGDSTIDIDEGQMRSVFVNLLLNSLDAMPGGGTIDISLDYDREQLTIRFNDSGPGISNEAMESLFTPFSSTKTTGTGLGLSICRRIVELHQGAIEAKNGSNGGAELEISLPLATSSFQLTSRITA